jgi:hypothetical protein
MTDLGKNERINVRILVCGTRSGLFGDKLATKEDLDQPVASPTPDAGGVTIKPSILERNPRRKPTSPQEESSVAACSHKSREEVATTTRCPQNPRAHCIKNMMTDERCAALCEPRMECRRTPQVCVLFPLCFNLQM